MTRSVRDIGPDRRGADSEPGFTLIELLIVVVVLGVLAATVIFALGGVTSQSAEAACQSDGKTYVVAVAAYEAARGNETNAPPTTTQELLDGFGSSGALLNQAANNQNYVVFLGGDDLTGETAAMKADTTGTVYVGRTVSSAVGYDTESSTTSSGCYGVE